VRKRATDAVEVVVSEGEGGAMQTTRTGGASARTETPDAPVIPR